MPTATRPIARTSVSSKHTACPSWVAMSTDNYNNQFLTIGDFVKICDVIKVGVFEVMIENHPKNREVKYNVYKNMSEYISTVPECFPKEETDPLIAEGKFDVSFAEYKYHFEVVGQSVVVHCMKTFEE